MLKFSLHLIRFIALTCILYIFLVIVWAELDYDSFIKPNEWYELKEASIDSLNNVNSHGHMFSRMKELEQSTNVDLIFVGSSQAYRGFDTRIFSKATYSSFNMGSSNQTPLQSEILLKRYLKQLAPQKIIYVVYPEVFEVDGVESSLDLLANTTLDFHLMRLVLSQKNLKLFNTMIYAAYRELFNLNKKFKEPVRKGNDYYVGGGYVEKEVTYYSPRAFDIKSWHFNENQLAALKRTIYFLKKEEIDYMLVQPPTPKSFYQSFTNNETFDSLMHTYGTYVNFNGIIELDDSLHFYDPYHLNQLGVEIFNGEFIKLYLSSESMN